MKSDFSNSDDWKLVSEFCLIFIVVTSILLFALEVTR